MPISFKYFCHCLIIVAMLLAVSFQLPAVSETIEKSSIDPSIPDLPLYSWQDPSKRTRAVVIAVHGTTQHSGSLEVLAKKLSDSGFLVVAFDLRGHGTHSANWINYARSVEDLVSVSQHLKKSNPRLPLYCIGESVGSAVTIQAAGEHAALFDGLVLVSAGTRPRMYSLSMVVPDFLRGITQLDLPLDVSRYITRYASEDERVTREMISDPYSKTKLSGKEILRTAGFLHRSTQFTRLVRHDIPVLILQGSEDKIVSADSARALLKRLRSTDKTMVVVPSCGHVLLGTSYIKPGVMKVLTDWLIAKTNLQSNYLLGKATSIDASNTMPAQ